jgi:hypothetical protein
MRAKIPTPATLRLDVWLDLACLFRTRSEAQKACKSGSARGRGERARRDEPQRGGCPPPLVAYSAADHYGEVSPERAGMSGREGGGPHAH